MPGARWPIAAVATALAVVALRSAIQLRSARLARPGGPKAVPPPLPSGSAPPARADPLSLGEFVSTHHGLVSAIALFIGIGGIGAESELGDWVSASFLGVGLVLLYELYRVMPRARLSGRLEVFGWGIAAAGFVVFALWWEALARAEPRLGRIPMLVILFVVTDLMVSSGRYRPRGRISRSIVAFVVVLVVVVAVAPAVLPVLSDAWDALSSLLQPLR